MSDRGNRGKTTTMLQTILPSLPRALTNWRTVSKQFKQPTKHDAAPERPSLSTTVQYYAPQTILVRGF